MSAERAEDDDGGVPDVFTFKMKRETISVHTECERKLADAQREVARLEYEWNQATGYQIARDQAEQRAAALEAALGTARYALVALPTMFPSVKDSATITRTVEIIDAALPRAAPRPEET